MFGEPTSAIPGWYSLSQKVEVCLPCCEMATAVVAVNDAASAWPEATRFAVLAPVLGRILRLMPYAVSKCSSEAMV